MNNLEAWAITQGYDPSRDYTSTSLPDGYLSQHFREAEFACNHCGELHPDGVPSELLGILEDVRAHFGGQPVTINSGYRCPTHNENVDGATNSQHLYGKAADIAIKDIAPSAVYKYLDEKVLNGGVGRYNSFTHVDVRGTKARW